MEIRSALPEDAPAASALLLGLAPQVLDAPGADVAGPFLRSLQVDAVCERFASSRFESWVAIDASGLCGLLVMRDDTHLYHLFVRQDRQRQGLAHRLWAHMRAIRTDRGTGAYAPDSITVNAAPGAVGFYQSLGFSPTGGFRDQDGTRFLPMAWHE